MLETSPKFFPPNLFPPKFSALNFLALNVYYYRLYILVYNIQYTIQSTSHNSDHTGLANFVRITENPDYVEIFSVLHFNRKLIGLSNSVRNIQKSG